MAKLFRRYHEPHTVSLELRAKARSRTLGDMSRKPIFCLKKAYREPIFANFRSGFRVLDLFQMRYLLLGLGFALVLAAAYVPCPKTRAEAGPRFISLGCSQAPASLQHACGEGNGLLRYTEECCLVFRCPFLFCGLGVHIKYIIYIILDNYNI